MMQHDKQDICRSYLRRADAVKNQAHIIATARRLFNAHGVNAVTMTQLAREANVGKGTLYRHFSSKVDVCYALIESEQVELKKCALDRVNSTQKPYETLRWFLHEAAKFVLENSDLLLGGFRHSDIESLTFEPTYWWRDLIRDLLTQIEPQKDADYSADVLYVLLNVYTIRYQQRLQGYSEARILKGLLEMLDAMLQ